MAAETGFLQASCHVSTEV